MYRDNAKAVEDYAAVARYENVFPELAESEDERIRMWLIDCVKATHGCYFETVTREQVLAYLEKLKERKPVNAAYISGIREELLGIEDNAKNIDGLTESQWVAIRAAHRLLGEYVEQEQKPAEWSEEDEKMLHIILTDINYAQKNYSTSRLTPYDKKVSWLKTLSLNLKKSNEDVAKLCSNEWSDKDKNVFNLALNLIKHSNDCHGLLDKELAVKWFAELPSRFVPQLKQEWNEEDENKIKDIIDYLECWNDFDHGSESFEECRKRMEGNIQFMKSLRPSWKPSEEQMDILDKVYHYLWADRNATADMQDGLGDLIDELKKL